jgi:predicted DNA-binding transcriptional regulator AlpA
LVSVTAIAEILGRSEKAIYDLKYRGVLPPPVRLGGSLYWLAEDIESWLQANREVDHR